MQLSRYRDLIKNLPYKEQAFETKQSTWKREYEKHQLFADFCNRSFIDGLLKLSRTDLFNAAKTDFHSAIFSIIIWGYPRNMRGSRFLDILNSLETIQSILPKEKPMNKDQFVLLSKQLNGTGIGMSTLTKILYFFSFKVESEQCLILDKRIIDVINDEIFSELSALGKITESNKVNKYLDYVYQIKKISEAGGYKPDQLELFLFQFGKNLKPDH